MCGGFRFQKKKKKEFFFFLYIYMGSGTEKLGDLHKEHGMKGGGLAFSGGGKKKNHGTVI